MITIRKPIPYDYRMEIVKRRKKGETYKFIAANVLLAACALVCILLMLMFLLTNGELSM